MWMVARFKMHRLRTYYNPAFFTKSYPALAITMNSPTSGHTGRNTADKDANDFQRAQDAYHAAFGAFPQSKDDIKLFETLYNSEDRTGGLTSQSKIVSASSDHTLRVWNATTGKEEYTLIGHSEAVTSVAVSPDRKTIASGSTDLIVRLWDTTTGRQTRLLTGHSSAIKSVAFAFDGTKLASGSDDGTVLVWDLATGQQERILSHTTASASYGYYGSQAHTIKHAVTSVVFSLDGKRIVAGTRDNGIWMSDIATGTQEPLSRHSSAITSLAISLNGRQMASGSTDGTVQIWDATTNQAQHLLSGHSGAITSIAFSPDGSKIATGSGDCTVRLWDAESAKEERNPMSQPSNVKSLAFSSDGRKIAAGLADHTLRLCDVATGLEECAFTGHSGDITGSAFF
ncbi:uncharacterized protein Triagg1_6287 [Trichoderma aggressivum f. europaeum]|uniref:WD40 repeat-like protein n=1 Tax=Trichoderma aggressivum f. europaeum TaxID=173218 RepID=A0AAE1LYS9_9HYPO|nr:hypothetical protein Triagg1_6287 [Trichoderma aggressivum f. europaeum]